MTDRRLQPRVAGHGARARVRLGHRLAIVDVSAGGALVEGQCPLRPGSRIEVQLESETRGGMVAARVTRCAVVAIDPESGITYRAALSFNESCDWVREATTQGGYRLPERSAPSGAPVPATGDEIPHVGTQAENAKGRTHK